ncbi:MAG: 3-oxoacyl-[acyl-carrier-protein] reductase [Lachnospiraceae bacterium]|nr:3-oxoacyl-[acyl-carrier-protein] reductase [Lachnospiraceae bacterium]MDY5743019.1 3-oxoacyl-[acyl-carrier-protein] reductase [Lachnospiraceae bacterium]
MKTAVVTGGARGIGRAICLQLARDGYRIITNYRSSAVEAEALRAEIKQLYDGECLVYQADVSDEEQVKAFFSFIKEEAESIDVLVNNAGITKDGLLARMSADAFDQVIAVNLRGVFLCSKAAAKRMMRQKSGRIIQLTSVSGIMGNIGQINYSAAKAGVIGLTKTMARELAAQGITVNAVAPGFIDTDMTAGLPESVKEQAVDRIPLQHFGKPEDIAATVGFLASEAAAYITGQVLAVDGGLSM